MDSIDENLRKIVKGAGLFFLGILIGSTISFAGKIIVIRYLSLSEFGVLSLCTVILTIISTLMSLGVPLGLARQASFYLGRNELENVNSIIRAGIYISLIAGLVSSAGLFMLSDNIANFFKIPEFSWVLRVFSITIPFIALKSSIMSVFRVYEKTEIKVIFEDVLPNFLRIGVVIIAIVFSLAFFGIILAYVLASIIPGVILIFYFLTNIKIGGKSRSLPYIKELLIFSFPLLIQSILGLLISWTDTLMIGYYLSSSQVGLYNGARALASNLNQILISMNFIYFPLISQLFARGKILEMNRTYVVTTKWLMSVSLPIFLILFLFPKSVLSLLYGQNYLEASDALRILSMGFFTHVMVGLNGMTLIALGNTRFPLIVSLFSAIANFSLNIILIPLLGINGAALASALTYIVANIINSFKLYWSYDINPFTKNYIKPIITSSVIVILIYSATINLEVKNWILPILFFIFITAYFLSLLFTKSFEQEDIMILLSIEKRLGLDLKWIKNLLKRFI